MFRYVKTFFAIAPSNDNRTDRNVNHDHNVQENEPLTERVDGEVDVEAATGNTESVKKKKATRRKEQSVLQAKLTKLAVQIGYAGEFALLISV